MDLSAINNIFYNVFDFCLDTWSAFFRFNNWYSYFMTFVIIFFSTKYFIVPIIGGRSGSSDTVSVIKNNNKNKKKDK